MEFSLSDTQKRALTLDRSSIARDRLPLSLPSLNYHQGYFLVTSCVWEVNPIGIRDVAQWRALA